MNQNESIKCNEIRLLRVINEDFLLINAILKINLQQIEKMQKYLNLKPN